MKKFTVNEPEEEETPVKGKKPTTVKVIFDFFFLSHFYQCTFWIILFYCILQYNNKVVYLANNIIVFEKDMKKTANEESAGEGDQSDDESSREVNDKVIIIRNSQTIQRNRSVLSFSGCLL